MRWSTLAVAAFGLAASTEGLNILLNNDDGFGSGNIREVYRLLKEKGHDVWIVAPVENQSATGGSSDFSSEGNLTAPSEYDIIPKGAPSIGTDPHDSHIWYYNGTPAACTFVALDYVLPKFANFSTPDLLLTGPNFGTNLGPFVWTLSGTAGAAYAGTGRGISSMALSGSNSPVAYNEVHNKTNQATWIAQVAVKVVDQFISTADVSDGSILPVGYGVNINIPPLSENFTDPPVVQARMTGDADTNYAAWDPKTGTFTWQNIKPLAPGVNACLNGDCSLPGETYVVSQNKVSVSYYIVDYDAPSTWNTKDLEQRLKPLTKN